METMTKEEAMKYCRYYGKVDLNKKPTNYEESRREAYARVEDFWIYNLQNAPEIISKDLELYKYAGLEDFNKDDGVPITLKAVLFADIISLWDMPDSVDVFKNSYLTKYLI